MSERLGGLTIEEWRRAAMTEHADLLDCRAERKRIEAETLPSVEQLARALLVAGMANDETSAAWWAREVFAALRDEP